VDHVTITIDGQDNWTLRSAEIIESLCTASAIVAEVEHADADVDPADMLGKWIAFSIPTLLDSQPTRWAGGIITRWETMNGAYSGEQGTIFRLHAAAPMVRMVLRRQTRQFNNASVLDVCRQLFDEWGEQVPASLGRSMMVLDNEPCMVPLQHIHQNAETDLEFISRLLHQSGVFTVNVCDGADASDTELRTCTMSRAARPWAQDLQLQYQSVTAGAALDHQITRWRRVANLVPSTPVVATWHPSVADNIAPSNRQAMTASPADKGFQGWEFIQHPLGAPLAGARMGALRDQLSRVREEALHLEQAWRHGQSTSTAIVTGCTIDPQDLPNDDQGPFLVTAMRLVVLGESLGSQIDLETPVRCAFNAVPLGVAFRPPIKNERLEPPPLDGAPLCNELDRIDLQETA